MAKIDIISGFLGAGKTTLIRKLLKEAYQDEKCVLIENEFGEIGIDGSFLKDSGIEIRELISGCICCSLVGDFGKAMQDVENEYHPDHIIIEPSGVGKLSDVIQAVRGAARNEPRLVLNTFTTIVDTKKCRLYYENFGEFFTNQIEFAGTIILSRTDCAKQEEIDDALSIIRTINSKSPVITTPAEKLSGQQIVDVMEKNNTLESQLAEELKASAEEEDEDEHEHHHHHHDHDHDDHDEHDHHHHHHGHDADEIFVSWGRETAAAYSGEELAEILKALADTAEYGLVLRAKGMLPDQNGKWHHFDMVPGECEIRDGAPEYTGRICVIGSRLKEDRLAGLFRL